MSIDFNQFISIAREEKAYDVLETWDENSFNIWTEEFGPMTLSDAYSLCSTIETVSEDEEAAGEYFAKR